MTRDDLSVAHFAVARDTAGHRTVPRTIAGVQRRRKRQCNGDTGQPAGGDLLYNRVRLDLVSKGPRIARDPP
jgi:hypothetical protein